jgi:hypothetical protein
MVNRNGIDAVMRSDIIDWLTSSSTAWAGALDDEVFLARLYDLRELPSTDGRAEYPTAAEDIWQHRTRNYDWPDDWVFNDSRFNLRHCPDKDFLKFLVETINPRVRPNPADAENIAGAYNDVLRRAGWRIVEQRRVGDSLYYEAARDAGLHSPSAVVVAPPDVRLRAQLETTLQRLRRDLETDPPAAIAHCKELIETQCKLILDELGESYSARDDLSDLYGAASRALGIHAASVTGDSRAAESVRSMLRNLASMVKNIGEARNSMGTGHGRAHPSPAEPRHARLVFNATVAVTEFVAETWQARS